MPTEKKEKISNQTFKEENQEKKSDQNQTSVEDFYQFIIGKRIVHSNYGIGIYRGLKI